MHPIPRVFTQNLIFFTIGYSITFDSTLKISRAFPFPFANGKLSLGDENEINSESLVLAPKKFLFCFLKMKLELVVSLSDPWLARSQVPKLEGVEIIGISEE